MSNRSTYYANGKLLLTGEYVVLHGARAIAMPLKVGQSLAVSESLTSGPIVWDAFYDGKIWFNCQLNSSNFAVLKTSNQEKAQTLSTIFQTIRTLNPDFHPKAGTKLGTVLESNPEWGFGSSSTLVSLLAQWSGVDSYTLNELVFQGSGFDIACATADGPIFYAKNKAVLPVALEYPFSGQLFLLYSGKKKGTALEVNSFLKEKKVSGKLIDEVSALSDEFANSTNQNDFNRLIGYHEKLVGDLIGKTPVKSEFFADFSGEIKSLGAWGGDFYLISSEQPFSEVKKYFENKGLFLLFHWDDLILKRQQP